MQLDSRTARPSGAGMYGALAKAQREGRTDLDGRPLDFTGAMAVLQARARGVADPEELRRISRAARKGAGR